MNRAEFIKRLEELLQNIPTEERAEAVQFYQGYFDDAGPENEALVIQELGSPEKVANQIKADIEEFSGENGEYTETGYKDERFDDRQMPVKKGYRYQQAKWSDRESQAGSRGESQGYHYTENGNNERAQGYHYAENEQVQENGTQANGTQANGAETNGTQPNGTQSEEKKPWTNPVLKMVLIIALILAASPVIFAVAAGAVGVGAGVLGAIFGVLCAILGLGIGLVIGAAAVMLSGIIIVVAGVAKMFSVASVGALTVGIGILVCVLGLVATVGTVKLCLIVYPAIFRGIVNLCRKPFHRKGAVQS